jgi:benzylsuccinate CoA-transferase BbsF subunit
MGPYAGGIKGFNRSAYFTNRNASKLGITLNMKTKEAVQLARRLVPTCDVVINNFRAGVLERLGLGYQDCAALRPDVIYVSMPLQGNAGPQAGYSGVGHTLNVMAGIYGVTGYRGGPMIGPGTNYPDHSVNPGHGLVAILAALLHRRRTGRGQYVEVSQLESTLCLLGPHILAYSLDRVTPEPMGNESDDAAPYGVFPCADAGWFALSVSTDAQWQGLAQVAAGQGWASDPRHATVAGRLAQAKALNAAVAEWIRPQDGFALMEMLQKARVPAGMVQTAKDLVERDPQLAARGHFVTMDHAEMGSVVYNDVPCKLSRTPGGIQRSAPLLGEHNDLVFREWLGVGDADMERMSAADVFK